MFNKDLLPKWNVHVGLSVEVGLKSGCGMVIVAQVAKSCPTLWDSMNCSMLGSSLCPSLSPWACSNSCPLSQWCHPTISSSVSPCSYCPQCFPASVSFPMIQLFASDGQNMYEVKWSENLSVMSNSLQPNGPYSPWNSPGQNTGEGSHSLLQGIFP